MLLSILPAAVRGIVGMWKGFAELEAIGWIGKKRPRFISVQSTGCAPIVKAWEEGATEATPWHGAGYRCERFTGATGDWRFSYSGGDS